MAMAISVVVPGQEAPSSSPFRLHPRFRQSSIFARQLCLPASSTIRTHRLSIRSLRAIGEEEAAASTATAKPYLLEVESEEEAATKTTEEERIRQSMAMAISLGIAFLIQTDSAEALGPGGPRVEEFWENMSRYGVYFLTVATGGIYSIVKPLVDLFKNPFSAVLLVGFLSGTFYLLYIILSTMLGLGLVDYTSP